MTSSRSWLALLLLGLAWLALESPARSQAPGSNDPTFNVVDDGSQGGGVDSTVLSMALMPDGRVVIGGFFTTYTFTPRIRVARLNADGTLDTSFQPGAGANGPVYSVAVQPDGKVLIGGDFSLYGGTPRNRVARLNVDGSLDTSFDPGSGASGRVHACTLQPDGKVLIGGVFTTYSGTARNRIARLNADGSLDVGFDPGTGTNSAVRVVVLQPDGRVLVAGEFANYDGTPRNRVARLNPDGSLDASFNPGSGVPSGYVAALAVRPDGGILIGGTFSSYAGVTTAGLAKAFPDGSVDASFSALGGAPGTESIALQPDGKFLVAGDFVSFMDLPRDRIARANADGTPDLGFDAPAGANHTIVSITPLPDGKTVIAGPFTTYNSSSRARIARLHPDGSLDASFDPGTGPNLSPVSVADQVDGKLVIGGDFTSYGGTPRNRVARLNVDGSLDASFDPGLGANDRIQSLFVQLDGKALIAGDFTSFHGVPRNRVARLDVDGSLDTTFNPGLGANQLVTVARPQSDGKVLIGGYFSTIDGVSRNFLARLNADGSLDTSFNTGTGPNGPVQAIHVQPDGKVLIGGSFVTYNGTPRSRIARLNANGSLDTSFHPGTGPNLPILAIGLQPDGRVLIVGSFSTFNGTPRAQIARVNANGSLDLSFDPGSGPDDYVESFALQPDGKALLGGQFASYDGTPRTRIARVHVYTPYTTYCEGPALACPCGNSGTAGNGCGNSVNAAGANLAAAGFPSLANDTLVLAGGGMPDSSALYFQGTTQSASAFGDGVRCASGAVVRLGTKINVAGASGYPTAGDPSVSVRGGVAAPGPRTYQIWYRNAAAFCTASTFNLSNGISVTWVP